MEKSATPSPPLPPVPLPPVDPLDAVVDGLALRDLLEIAENRRSIEGNGLVRRPLTTYAQRFTPAQRAALSAHWSAELRRRVAASKAADDARRPRVVLDYAEDM